MVFINVPGIQPGKDVSSILGGSQAEQALRHLHPASVPANLPCRRRNSPLSFNMQASFFTSDFLHRDGLHGKGPILRPFCMLLTCYAVHTVHVGHDNFAGLCPDNPMQQSAMDTCAA